MAKRRPSHGQATTRVGGSVRALLHSVTLWWAILFAAVFPIIFRQVSVSDAWWHAALGKWMVTRGSLPDLTKFYFSPVDAGSLLSELRWEWLGDIVLYLCYAAGGAAGIQWLVVGCVMASVFFLSRLAPDRRGPWVLVLLAAVCLGTYQLQLARNSVFSLALYPALLWLGVRKQGPPEWREYAASAALLFLWSCLHGSCVLGWVTACLLFGLRAVSAFRHGGWNLRAGLKSTALCAAALFISLLLVIMGRSGAVDFLLLPARHLSSTIQVQTATPGDAGISSPSKQSPSIKAWLNSTIWKRDLAVPWSNDYWSPLDMLPGMRPIEAAYALAVLAAIGMAIFRNVPFGLLLAWLGAVFLGLGYVRMFGYTALASGAVILVATHHWELWKKPLVTRLGWVALGIWILAAWGMFFSSQIGNFIPEGQHVSRRGQVPIFDDAVADWVKTNFPNEPVFTTIETGSYCLLRWGFEKPVFLDGFFAAHPREVWTAYNEALRDDNLSLLNEKFGIKIAIIPTTSSQWLDRFRHSPDWNPVAIGAGSVVFAHRSIPLAGRSPQIFCTASDLRQTSFYFRHAALKVIFLITSSAAESGGGFPPELWTAHPSFIGIRELAQEVFPKL